MEGGRECISPATGGRGQVGGNLIIHENFPILERERHFPEVGVVNIGLISFEAIVNSSCSTLLIYYL